MTSLRHHLKLIRTSTQVAVLLDMNGSKPRIGKIGGEGYIRLQEGNRFTFNLGDKDVIGSAAEVYADFPVDAVKVGDKICVDDGKIAFTVMQILQEEKKIETVIDNDGKYHMLCSFMFIFVHSCSFLFRQAFVWQRHYCAVHALSRRCGLGRERCSRHSVCDRFTS